jgi:hypothetical protein
MGADGWDVECVGALLQHECKRSTPIFVMKASGVCLAQLQRPNGQPKVHACAATIV